MRKIRLFCSVRTVEEDGFLPVQEIITKYWVNLTDISLCVISSVNVGTAIKSVTSHTNTDTGTSASSSFFSQRVTHSVFAFHVPWQSINFGVPILRQTLLCEVYLMYFTQLDNLALLRSSVDWMNFSGWHVIDFALRLFGKVWVEPKTCNEAVTLINMKITEAS